MSHGFGIKFDIHVGMVSFGVRLMVDTLHTLFDHISVTIFQFYIINYIEP